MSDAAVGALLSWQLRQAEEAEAAPEAWRTEGHVFTMEDGRALDPSYVTRLFSTLRKAGGEELPPLSFHGLRHCSASLMLAPVPTLQSCPNCSDMRASRSPLTCTATWSVPSPRRP
jgi:integrase